VAVEIAAVHEPPLAGSEHHPVVGQCLNRSVMAMATESGRGTSLVLRFFGGAIVGLLRTMRTC
jgi:hypothetical protein